MPGLHGLEVEILSEGEVESSSANLRIHLFHVTRELFFNVAKHAWTDRADVEVMKESLPPCDPPSRRAGAPSALSP